MRTLILFELRKTRRIILTLALATGAMVFFSMMFFPTISKNLTLLGDFLNSGFMQGIMTAFNVDVFAMKTLRGFFAGYCTMWVVLLGSIFFGYLGSEWLAKEERTGTIEFLLSKPLTRQQVFLSKLVALFISCAAFIALVGLVGLLGIGFQHKNAPYEVYMTHYDESVRTLILDKQEHLRPYVQFDEADFTAFTAALMMQQYKDNQAAIEASELDLERLMQSIEGDLSDPETLFDNMMEDPEAYLGLIGSDMTAEAFKSAIEREREQYLRLKATFLNDNRVLGAMFGLNPEYFLNHWIQSGDIETVDGLLDEQLTMSGLISKIDLEGYAVMLLKMFIVVLSCGMLGISMAAVSGETGSVSPKVMVVVLILYFVNSLSEISASLGWLRYLTPFGYVDTGTLRLDPKPLILLLVLSIITGIALTRYRVKNFSV